MESERKVIHILARRAGRSVLADAQGVKVRFDSVDDRLRFELLARLRERVERQDIKAAASVVLDALNEGIIADEEEILDAIADDEAREIVRLELSGMVMKAIEGFTARIGLDWRSDD
jgi:hypothetical protein